MGKEWSEERKKKWSDIMTERMKDPANRQKLKDGWKKTERYQRTEGRHQMEDIDQKRAYQREYHREWYKKNKEKVAHWTKDYYERHKVLKSEMPDEDE